MIRTRFALLPALAGALAAGSLSAADPPPKPNLPKPNIVILFADDLGYGDVGAFGGKLVKTPHLDALAAEGMKFTSFYATPVCSMSRACLLTGCYNVRVSVPGVLFPNSAKGLNPEETTLAEIAKSQGYATACIGKWHLGHREPFLPTKQGFDSYFGIPYSNDMTIDPKHARFASDCLFREGTTEAKAREGAVKNTVPLMRGLEVVEYPADQSTLTQRYTQEAVAFIRKHQAEPFLLYLPYAMVHHPLAASPEFLGKSGGGLLGDAIVELDWSVGEIAKTLKELQLDSKTLVMFSSDNGAAAGSSAPWRGKKASVYEGGVREPCIMKWPGRIPAGTVCDRIAGNIDVLPTVAALVGAPLPKDRELDGRDVSSLLFKEGAPSVRDVQLHFNGAGRLAAIRQGDWKLMLASPARPKAPQDQIAPPKPNDPPDAPVLYDLAKDPQEARDVAAAHPDVVERLRGEALRLDQEIRESRRPAGEIPKDAP